MTDPKLSALKTAIRRVSAMASPLTLMLCREQKRNGVVIHRARCLPCRFTALWQARNRRTRVMMARARVL